jgi:hypothetical protein
MNTKSTTQTAENNFTRINKKSVMLLWHAQPLCPLKHKLLSLVLGNIFPFNLSIEISLSSRKEQRTTHFALCILFQTKVDITLFVKTLLTVQYRTEYMLHTYRPTNYFAGIQLLLLFRQEFLFAIIPPKLQFASIFSLEKKNKSMQFE